jgi:DNA-binding NarL/FixJ family response regulator
MMGESIVLVITPSPDMTNKIQQTLDNIGGYIVISSSTPTEALELTQKSIINACILDIFHPDFPVLPVVKELKNKQPEMRLILILSNHGLSLQDIPGIIPDGFLPRSFNTIQLMSALGHTPKISMPPKPSSSLTSQTIPGSSHKPASQDPLSNPLPFSKSEDFTNLSQRLSNLSTETNALAVIILRRKQLLSHVGTLPYAAIQELVDLINSYSRVSAQNLQKQLKPGQSKSGNGDMIRFIQLQSIQGRYLLYVISLTKEMLLALLFDQDTQFSKVRRQTILISHELLTPQRSVPLEYRPSSPDIERQAPAQPTDLTPAEEIFELSETQPTSPLTEPKVEQPPDTTGVPTPSETKPPEFDKEEIGTISPRGMTTPDAGMDIMTALNWMIRGLVNRWVL